MVDAAEVCQAKGADVVIYRRVATNDRELGWWFGGFAARPDDVWRFNVGVRQVEDGSELLNIKNKASIEEGARSVVCEVFFFEASRGHLEAV